MDCLRPRLPARSRFATTCPRRISRGTSQGRGSPPLSSEGGASEKAASVESSRKLEVSPIRTSRSPEVGAVEGGERVPIEGVKPGDPADLVGSDLADLTLPTADPKSLAARVVIKTIGRLRLEINGRDLTQRLNEQPRLEFLFSYLLARATRAADAAIDRPALADEVAPGIPAGNQRDRLRKQLHALQSTLGSEAKTLLRINNTHVTLDLTGVDIDTVALEQMSRLVGRRKTLIGGDLADQIRALLEETAGGEFLAGFSELEHQVTAGNGTASQTVEEARALIAGWRADLVQALANYNGAAGYPQRSIAYLKSALTQCPQRQDLARLLSPPTSRLDRRLVLQRRVSSTTSHRRNEMSIEVETKKPESLNGQVAPATGLSVASGRLPIWRRRRYQVPALLAAVAFVAALVGNNLLARQYTPDGAVRQYLSALQAGDAAKAWDAVKSQRRALP